MARCEMSDFEWRVIEPLLPQNSRGVPRVDDRRVLNGIFWVYVQARLGPIYPVASVRTRPVIIGFAVRQKLAFGTGLWTRLQMLMMKTYA